MPIILLSFHASGGNYGGWGTSFWGPTSINGPRRLCESLPPSKVSLLPCPSTTESSPDYTITHTYTHVQYTYVCYKLHRPIHTLFAKTTDKLANCSRGVQIPQICCTFPASQGLDQRVFNSTCCGCCGRPNPKTAQNS